MAENPTSKQFGRPGRRLGFFFLFRIRPGFFIGFIPRRFGAFSESFGSDQYDDMVIERISEEDYMVLQRLGIMEVQVMM